MHEVSKPDRGFVECDGGSCWFVCTLMTAIDPGRETAHYESQGVTGVTTPPSQRSAWWWRALAIAVTLFSTAAVMSTARVFSATYDEPAHLAAGIQWLSTGWYYYDLQHPPLARVITSLGPYLAGLRTVGKPDMWTEGAALLGSGAHYAHMLALARYGSAIFLVLGALAVWLWGRRLLGEAGGAIATVLLVTNPTMLAHAGLATNDAAVAATSALALYATLLWLERPDWRRSALLGGAFALAISTKFSALPFVGSALVVGYLLRGFMAGIWAIPGPRVIGGAPRRPARSAAIGTVVAVMLLAIWSLYRFHMGHLWLVSFRVPAPALWAGLYTFLIHGGTGHPGFLLGSVSSHGWWYYFPVALLVKSPLPLLFLATVGAYAAWNGLRGRRRWEAAFPIGGALAMLILATQVRVNIGVRHILPIYPLLAIAGAQGVLLLWARVADRRVARAAAVIACACAIVIPIRAYPDYLPYFNPLAGAHPENVLVDSNLDWGQDLYRLRDTLRARGVTGPVALAYFGSTDPRAIGIPNAVPYVPGRTAADWIAVSRTYLAGEWGGSAYEGLLRYPPAARIGKSMLLWHWVPEQTPRPPTVTRAPTTAPSPR